MERERQLWEEIYSNCAFHGYDHVNVLILDIVLFL